MYLKSVIDYLNILTSIYLLKHAQIVIELIAFNIVKKLHSPYQLKFFLLAIIYKLADYGKLLYFLMNYLFYLFSNLLFYKFPISS